MVYQFYHPYHVLQTLLKMIVILTSPLVHFGLQLIGHSVDQLPAIKSFTTLLHSGDANRGNQYNSIKIEFRDGVITVSGSGTSISGDLNDNSFDNFLPEVWAACKMNTIIT